MKKIVYFWLIALCLPIGLMAQSVDDDLYFVPSKDKKEEAKAPVKRETSKQVTHIYTSPGTTVVVQDRKGRTRDVDEYNRRYDARDNDFAMDNDTLYIREKSASDLDGEWVTGDFNGTQDDYEYAERIIRFRNPRFAISISSPLYWDLVYGVNSWDWNVYTDGLYAYAFPTFSNPLWWDWRYNYWGWGYGWNYGWGWRPYYYSGWGYYPGYWGGWYGDYYWGHHHYWGGGPGWGWGGNHFAHSTFTNRRTYGYNHFAPSRRPGATSTERRSAISTDRRSSASRAYTGRTVGTRREATRVSTQRATTGETTRSNVSSSRRSAVYTRPSSTRSSSTSGTIRRSSSTSSPAYRPSSTETSRRTSTYNRGTSTTSSPSRVYNNSSSTRSSSTPSYSTRSSGSSRSSVGTYSGGSRSSAGGGSSRGGRR